MTPAWIMDAAAAAIGATAGSHAATAAIRAGRAEQSLTGRSHCDGCGMMLGLAQTVPVASFVGLGGACAGCGARIDPLHPAGEIAGGALALGAMLLAPPSRALPLAGLGLVLLASSLIDLKTRRLPDLLTLVVGGLCAVLALQGGLGRLEVGLAAGAITFVALEGLRRGFEALRRKPGLGFGDVKLLAALAIWLGAAIPWAIVLASAGGLMACAIARPKDGRIPFGPFIAAGAFAVGMLSEVTGWPSRI